MKIDTILWLILPLLGIITFAAAGKLQPRRGTSRKDLVVGVAVAAAIIAVYVYARYVIFPPTVSA